MYSGNEHMEAVLRARHIERRTMTRRHQLRYQAPHEIPIIAPHETVPLFEGDSEDVRLVKARQMRG